jgi:hypothetical protein
MTNTTTRPRRPSAYAAALALPLLLAACGPRGEAAWPPAAQKWFDRAEHSYSVGDLEDARHASDEALAALPEEPEVRLVAARIALATLDFERALEMTRALPGSEAASLRGRAHWYRGETDLAADELETLLADPEVRDPWAEQVARLARIGRGRRPFEVSGGLLGVVEMPRTGSTAMIVPVELNGEPTLAMIATDVAEAVVDSGTSQGSWVSLRFGGRLEVSDVPAIGRDLSGLSRQIGVPVKLLIGVNLLRQLRATIDVAGSQFVVRSYEPPPPPGATTVHPIFYKGGAMVLPGAFGAEPSAPPTSLLMNTSLAYPLALDAAAWKKAGKDPASFAVVPGQSNLRYGTVDLLRLGAFEIPQVPGVSGTPIDELETALAVDLDGFAGAGLFGTFRLTFADGGRTLWMEDLPAEVIEARMRAVESLRRAERLGATVEGEPSPGGGASAVSAPGPATSSPPPAGRSGSGPLPSPPSPSTPRGGQP